MKNMNLELHSTREAVTVRPGLNVRPREAASGTIVNSYWEVVGNDSAARFLAWTSRSLILLKTKWCDGSTEYKLEPAEKTAWAERRGLPEMRLAVLFDNVVVWPVPVCPTA